MEVQGQNSNNNKKGWWWLLGGVALVGLVWAFSDESEEKEKKVRKAYKKKVFISFAIEDQRYRDFLVGQAKVDHSPFDFIDMSVKEPWNEAEWKRKCRNKIKQCDGLIILLSKYTWRASGARWEIKCAIEEGLRVAGMHIKHWDQGAIPTELEGRKVMTWSWENLRKFIDRL